MEHLTKIQLICVFILPIIFAVTLHEVAHGYVAKLLGDKTAMLLGRLSFNPLKHIDFFGTLIVPLLLLFFSKIIFGWAKPVPVTSKNFRYPKRDMVLVAIAGPISNFLMAIFWALIFKFGHYLYHYGLGFDWALAIVYMGQAGVMINIVFFVLNLLPIPPLDGGHILISVLPRYLAIYLERHLWVEFIILLILIVSGALGAVIGVPSEFLLKFFNSVFGV